MDELLANLSTDAPMFDTPSVLGPAFDMDSGFMSDTNDNVSIFPPDISGTISGTLRNQPPSSAPVVTTPTPQNMQLAPAEIDYLAVDDAEAPPVATASARNPTQQPTLSPAATTPKQETVMFADLPSSSAVPSAIPSSTAAAITSPPVPPGKQEPATTVRTPAVTADPIVPDELPDTPAAAERRRLRPLASEVVQQSWCASRNPADFVAAVKQRLPVRGNQLQPQSIVEESSGPRTATATEEAKPEGNSENNGEVLWQLPEASEGALLDALFVRMVKGSATSSRFMMYLSYSLVTGIVSQRAVIATCLTWVSTTPEICNRVLQSFAKLMAQIIPNYRFSLTDEDLTSEVKEFLGAFTMIIKCTAKTPAFAPELVSVLSHDRVVALVRTCARRVPSLWTQIDAAIAELETPPSDAIDNFQQTFAPQSAYGFAPQLRHLIPRLKKGLYMGITSLETISKTVGSIDVPGPDAQLSSAITTAFEMTWRMFGKDMSKSLRELWIPREGPRGDFPLLIALERAAVSSQNEQAPASQKEDFRNKVITCQAIVRFLSERASVPGAADQWKTLWGGKERLKRIIRDAIPQVKTEIKSESGALLVSLVVVSCAAMILGPALRITDPNDGVDLEDPEAMSLQANQNEEVEETMGELIGFAVGSLEDAATAEEIPSWRSFGLWLLLLMSRCGSMLRASGCEHVRAARVLHAWAGIPTGTPGSHATHSSTHKHSSQGGTGHQHAPSSSSLSAVTEGVTTFASSASLAIIDVSDESGTDETIRSLCEDLVQ